MNLHVTSDNYGFFPKEIAKRIKKQEPLQKNIIVNLGENSIITDDLITYISVSSKAMKNYINTVEKIDKLIFHPYNFLGYKFLQIALKKFPRVKVYWVFWSFELYNLPHLSFEHYKPHAKDYIRKQRTLAEKIKNIKIIGNFVLRIFYITGIKKNSIKKLTGSFQRIDFFCSFLPSDFSFFRKISSNEKAKYLPFAYFSLEDIMPGLNNFKSNGNKIMIGHSSAPTGNHYEIIERLSELNPEFSIFLPLAYGDENYGNLIEKKARQQFKLLDIQRKKLETVAYYKKLTEVGWSIFNIKVQQGLGNIIALIWMGVKVFLDEESSTYKDFSHWGIIIFTIQHDLTLWQLTNKLNNKEIENNKAIILKKCNTESVNLYWDNIVA